MNVLIITQKVDINDDVLGFFHDWIIEFCKKYEKVTVVCLKKGSYNFPENVKVLSLGKEQKECRLNYVWNFFKYIWRERKNYDVVFVHMNQVYVVLGGILWKIWNKKIGLWYTHKKVTLSLRIAEKMADIIFTASKESFRLKSSKIEVVGHGIDINKFENSNRRFEISEILKIIAIGRISPVKGYDVLIRAAEILKKENIKFAIDIIGGPGTDEQVQYFEKLKKEAVDKELGNYINFLGALPNHEISKYLKKYEVFVHTSQTGSLDKAFLEACASGLLTVSCNDASKDVLGKYTNKLWYEAGNEKELAKRLVEINKISINEKEAISKSLFYSVKRDHNIYNLFNKISKIL